jgi:hypothetical protein
MFPSANNFEGERRQVCAGSRCGGRSAAPRRARRRGTTASDTGANEKPYVVQPGHHPWAFAGTAANGWSFGHGIEVDRRAILAFRDDRARADLERDGDHDAEMTYYRAASGAACGRVLDHGLDRRRRWPASWRTSGAARPAGEARSRKP